MPKNFYWIKLYHDILANPKMGALDDTTWRRTIELFLVAGDHHQDGALPPNDEIAWILHTSQDEIVGVLSALEQIGITSRDEDGNWCVTNFVKRQTAVSGADRARAYRNRREARDDDRYANRDAASEADLHSSVAQPCERSARDTDTDSESESDPESDTDPEKDTVRETHTLDSDVNTPVCDEHTPAQAYFVRLFKIQPTPNQLLTLAQLEKTHGYCRLTQVIDWAVSSGIPPGRALRAIRTAIITWSERPPTDSRAGNPHRTGALEKLRKEYSGDINT